MFGFFVCCDELGPSAERFSPEAWDRGVGTLNGMAEMSGNRHAEVRICSSHLARRYPRTNESKHVRARMFHTSRHIAWTDTTHARAHPRFKLVRIHEVETTATPAPQFSPRVDEGNAIEQEDRSCARLSSQESSS